MAKQETCEQRVESQLESGLDDLRRLWEAYQKGEEDVEDLGNIYEYGLCFDYVAPDTFGDQSEGYFRYQISYGGPSSEYRFYTNPDFSSYKVEYWFLDWFDGANRTLSGTDKELLMEIYDWFKDCGTVENEYEKAKN